jgi:hypothetical protein
MKNLTSSLESVLDHVDGKETSGRSTFIKTIKQDEFNKNTAIQVIKLVQSGKFDQNAVDVPKGNIAKNLWSDVTFKLGMEYGVISVLMGIFNLTEDDLNVASEVDSDLKQYQIWSEGFVVTGNSGTAKLVAAGIKASTFKDACDGFYKDKDRKDWGEYDSDRLTIWGCKLFDNEEDARKAFG